MYKHILTTPINTSLFNNKSTPFKRQQIIVYTFGFGWFNAIQDSTCSKAPMSSCLPRARLRTGRTIRQGVVKRKRPGYMLALPVWGTRTISVQGGTRFSFSTCKGRSTQVNVCLYSTISYRVSLKVDGCWNAFMVTLSLWWMFKKME